MPTVEIDLIRQLTRTLRKVSIIAGIGVLFPPDGPRSPLSDEVGCALEAADAFLIERGLDDSGEDPP
jgi:hypothetical protein